MTALGPLRTPERSAREDTRTDSVATTCDRVLDAAVVVLATWTVVYHVCFVFKVSAVMALVVEVAVLVAGALAWRSRRVAREPFATGQDVVAQSARLAPSRLLWTLLGATAVAALAMAFRLPWLLVWVPWLVAGVAGLLLAVRRLGVAAPTGPADEPTSRRESWLALGLAIAAGVFSTITLRPNPDDLFYVNLSQWVAAHGTFPHRDTLFADLTYPMSNWPPLASYDAGTGALAHVLGIHAATVDYVGVTPVATVLSVLALWRLLRAWRVSQVGVALVAALVFLLVDGTSSYGPPGNLFLTRLWQGKVILLCLLVPLLLVHVLRYVDRPTRARAAWLFVLGTASIGLSTTAIFLVPVVAIAGVAPLLVKDRSRLGPALWGFAAMSAYPLGSGALTVALGGRSADDFGLRRQYRFDPAWFGHEVFLDGLLAVIAVVAVLVGCLLVPHPAARVTSAVTVLVVGISFVPHLTRVTYALVGLGPTLWRLTWALSIAALVGVAAAWCAERLPERLPTRLPTGMHERLPRVVRERVPARWGMPLPLRVQARMVSWGSAVLGVLVLAAFGAPIWAADTSTMFAAPPHWQRGPDSITASSWLLSHSKPGGVVLGPDGLSITVAVRTTDVKTVTPRDYYMYYLHDDPGFHYDQRLTLVRFANHNHGFQPADVGPALAVLGVQAVCIYRTDHTGGELLHALGWHNDLKTETYRCLLPPTGSVSDGVSGTGSA